MLAYALALAPVLLAGRVSMSSFMTLSDSAVHLIGADFLIRHGQHYAHLDLRNSYGQFINDYYNTSYPSGADTLFGGSAFLLGLSLMWAFQPFNAFMLAHRRRPRVAAGAAHGPARARGRRSRRSRAVVPALVYAYELFGSVKEMTALPMILTLGALVVAHRGWLRAGARARDPVRRSSPPPASRRSVSPSARGRSRRRSCSRWCSWASCATEAGAAGRGGASRCCSAPARSRR